MTAFAKKMKEAGVDTFSAQFYNMAVDALRKNSDARKAWDILGDKFGYEYMVRVKRDMSGTTETANGTTANNPRKPTPSIEKPYRPRVIAPETIDRRRKLREATRKILSKYRCYDGRSYSEVGIHESGGMERQGREMAALRAALPAYVPNDGRTFGDVLTTAQIDAIIEDVRSKDVDAD